MGKMQQVPGGQSVIAPINAGQRIIMNFVSEGPKFDQKLDKMIERVWKRVRDDYFGWASDLKNFKSGAIKDTVVASDTYVVNMLVRDKNNVVNSSALEKALEQLSKFAKSEKCSVHISELLVEEVPALKPLVQKHIAANGINCYFYEVAVDKK